MEYNRKFNAQDRKAPIISFNAEKLHFAYLSPK